MKLLFIALFCVYLANADLAGSCYSCSAIEQSGECSAKPHCKFALGICKDKDCNELPSIDYCVVGSIRGPDQPNNKCQVSLNGCVDYQTPDFKKLCSAQLNEADCQNTNDTFFYCNWLVSASIPSCLPKNCSQIKKTEPCDKDKNEGASDVCQKSVGQGCIKKDADYTKPCFNMNYEACTYIKGGYNYCEWSKSTSACQNRECKDIKSSDLCKMGIGAIRAQDNTSINNKCELEVCQAMEFKRQCDDQKNEIDCQNEGDTDSYCVWSEKYERCYNLPCQDIRNANACQYGNERGKQSPQNACEQDNKIGGFCRNSTPKDFTKPCNKQMTQSECLDIDDTVKYCKWEEGQCKDLECSKITLPEACWQGNARSSESGESKCFFFDGACVSDNQKADFTLKCNTITSASECQDELDTKFYCQWDEVSKQCLDLGCHDIQDDRACSEGNARGTDCEQTFDGFCMIKTVTDWTKVCREQSTIRQCHDYDDTNNYCTWSYESKSCVDMLCSEILDNRACQESNARSASQQSKYSCKITDKGKCTFYEMDQKCAEAKSETQCLDVPFSLYCSWKENLCQDANCIDIKDSRACQLGGIRYGNLSQTDQNICYYYGDRCINLQFNASLIEIFIVLVVLTFATMIQL